MKSHPCCLYFLQVSTPAYKASQIAVKPSGVAIVDKTKCKDRAVLKYVFK